MTKGVVMNWRQFIQVMKIDERAARAKYQSAAKAAKSPAIKEIFDKLAYEEEVHIGVLEKFEKDLKALLADEKKR
jgi:rubrerythrin